MSNVFIIEDIMPEPTPIERHLPVRPAAFAVIATLASGPRAGFEIMEAAEALPGRPIFGPGTLYRLLRELRGDGLIEPTPPPGGARSDERRQYHALTPLGRRVLEAEAERLRATLSSVGLTKNHG